MRIGLDLDASELSDLLRIPEFAELWDAGRISVLKENSPNSIEGSTRQRGREYFERKVLEHGFRIRAIAEAAVSDFEVESVRRSRPVRLVCSESPRISLRKEWGQVPNLVCAFVWVLTDRTRIFLMSYEEAAQILGAKALGSPSFKERHFYTTVVTPRRQQAMDPFEDRWQIFE